MIGWRGDEEVALVCSGCYNKIPACDLNKINRHLFLTVLEARKSRIKVPEDVVSGEDLISDSLVSVFLLCPYVVKGARELLGVIL